MWIAEWYWGWVWSPPFQKRQSVLDLYGKKPCIFFRRPPCLKILNYPCSRIDARTPPTVRDTIDRVAALQGRTRTDFLIESALEKAERGIAEQTLIRLTLRDQELLAKALTEESVSESNRFLKSLTSEYGERVTQAWSCFLAFYPPAMDKSGFSCGEAVDIYLQKLAS